MSAESAQAAVEEFQLTRVSERTLKTRMIRSLRQRPIYRPKHRLSSLISGVLAMLLQFTSDAGNLDYCDARYPSISSYQAPPDFPEDRRDKIDISADKTLSGKDGSSTFKGDVIVERHELRVRADSARFTGASTPGVRTVASPRVYRPAGPAPGP